MSRILISKTDAIGDLILSLPVVRSIKEKYPEHQLTMLVSQYTSELLEQEDYIDDLITIQGRSVGSVHELKQLTDRMISLSFDSALFIYPRFGLALAAMLAGIRQRIGSAYRPYSMLFTERIKLHRRDSGKHELDLNYELANSVFPDLPRHEPQLLVSNRELSKARKLLEETGIEKDSSLILIHPLSRGSAPNWPLENYLDLADRIAESGLTVAFTGSSDEREQITQALQSRKAEHLNLAGLSDLSTLVGMIKQADMIICSSTGPIHIATAVGTFAIGLYPPDSALSATRWGPRGGANRLFVPRVEGMAVDAQTCMEDIEVEAVSTYVLSKCENMRKMHGEQ
jgi:ADP-heptose:LPS heptosyltransferase